MANVASAFAPNDRPLGLVVLRIMITAFAAPMTLQVASTVALTMPAADRQRVATSPFAFGNTRSTPVTFTPCSAGEQVWGAG
jgi:hypothetical protein